MTCPACGRENPTDSRFCAGCGALLPAEEQPPGTLVGRTLGGRYLVRRVIGEGGMGVVYEAEQRMGDGTRAVAIKTLHPQYSEDRTLAERFMRECRVVSQLEHPNTIRFYDFGQTEDGTLYIVMELARGRSLSDVIGAGALPVERAVDIVRQVAGALDEAHEQGIIHRDLKPDNIILTRRGGNEDFVKLLDFGIATRDASESSERPQTRLTEQGMVLGTPPYMSPEQLAGEKLTRRTDIYSLGIIAYEMLAGHLPFEADSSYAWASAHMTRTPQPLPPSVPAGVARAVAWALSKREADRPASAGAFAAALVAGAQGKKVDTLDDLPAAGNGPSTSPMPVVPAAASLQGGAGVPAALPPASAWAPAPAPWSAAASAAPPVLSIPSTAVSPPLRTEAPFSAMVPAPPPRPPPRRGAALPYVLGAIFTALAGGGVVVYSLQVREGNGGESPPGPLTGVTSGVATIAPEVVPPELTPSPTGAPVVTPPAPPTGGRPRPPPGPTSPGTTAPPASTTPPPATTTPPPATTTPPPATTTPPPATTTPPPATTTPPPATTTPPPTGGGDAACDQARALAGSGNIEGAVAQYRACQSGGGSATALASAKARITASAPGAVRARAFNGDCAGARSAVTAAQSIGAGGPAAAALKGTACNG